MSLREGFSIVANYSIVKFTILIKLEIRLYISVSTFSYIAPKLMVVHTIKSLSCSYNEYIG